MTSPSTHPATARKVLVVDDDPWTRTVTSALLASEGYHVVEARNGEEGLDAVRTHTPDLVLLDLALPRLPGAEVLRAIRGNAATRALPVFIVSAFSDLVSDETAAQASKIVQKPWDNEELLNLVGEAVSATRAPIQFVNA